MLNDPVCHGLPKPNVMTGFLGLNPFVLQDFFAFGLELPVKQRMLEQIAVREARFRFVRHNSKSRVRFSAQSCGFPDQVPVSFRIESGCRGVAVRLASGLRCATAPKPCLSRSRTVSTGPSSRSIGGEQGKQERASRAVYACLHIRQANTTTLRVTRLTAMRVHLFISHSRFVFFGRS